jgi:signal transduction histidine kinase
MWWAVGIMTYSLHESNFEDMQILVLVIMATILLLGLSFYLRFQISKRAKLLTELEDERNKLRISNIKLRATNVALNESKCEAEVASQAKSQFLTNMSHELRTPLNAIIGFSQIIKDQIMGSIGLPIYAEYGNHIFDAGEHLLSIINNLLDISKLEAGKTELDEEILDPAEIVSQSVRLTCSQAAVKEISLRVDIQRWIPFIRGDSLRLRQVIINLLSNAIKFTENGGNVSTSVTYDAVRGFSFIVADSGIGMSPDEIVIALKPFAQIQNSYTKKYQGTGLGLPLSKRLIELHHGRMEVTSNVGAGTTVIVVLPPERVILQPYELQLHELQPREAQRTGVVHQFPEKIGRSQSQ